MTSLELAVCVDFGSTFTKALLVDLDRGRVLAWASHPTTVDSDVLDGYDACRDALATQDARALDAPALACSSAGGGLRIAVVGNEELVTAEAGRRVALSSGGAVVSVTAVGGGGSVEDGLGADPDVVLLTGGTDGGNTAVLLDATHRLVAGGWRGPVVVAGNAAVSGDVAGLLAAAGAAYVVADNVLPRIGQLAPASARAAVRSMFVRHVIGGKHLSARADFPAMVRGATPDVVLSGVELLARGLGPEHPGIGDVVVVDVGGATTDVHSVVEADPEAGVDDCGLAREVVAHTPASRTVEADLGLRWSAVSTVEAAGQSALAAAATRRRDHPALVPTTAEEWDEDEAIAVAAVGLALRRHAGRARVVVSPEGRVVERTGKDLRRVGLLIASGGVLRHGPHGVAQRVVSAALAGSAEEGWQLPAAPRLVVDREYVLAAAGLLVAEHPEAAYRLARQLAGNRPSDHQARHGGHRTPARG